MVSKQKRSRRRSLGSKGVVRRKSKRRSSKRRSSKRRSSKRRSSKRRSSKRRSSKRRSSKRRSSKRRSRRKQRGGAQKLAPTFGDGEGIGHFSLQSCNDQSKEGEHLISILETLPQTLTKAESITTGIELLKEIDFSTLKLKWSGFWMDEPLDTNINNFVDEFGFPDIQTTPSGRAIVRKTKTVADIIAGTPDQKKQWKDVEEEYRTHLETNNLDRTAKELSTYLKSKCRSPNVLSRPTESHSSEILNDNNKFQVILGKLDMTNKYSFHPNYLVLMGAWSLIKNDLLVSGIVHQQLSYPLHPSQTLDDVILARLCLSGTDISNFTYSDYISLDIDDPDARTEAFKSGSSWPKRWTELIDKGLVKNYTTELAAGGGPTTPSHNAAGFYNRTPTYKDNSRIEGLDAQGVKYPELFYHFMGDGMVSGRETCMMNLGGLHFYLIKINNNIQPYIFVSKLEFNEFNTKIKERVATPPRPTTTVEVFEYQDPTANNAKCKGHGGISNSICIDANLKE
jgi:hypothetical protein